MLGCMCGPKNDVFSKTDPISPSRTQVVCLSLLCASFRDANFWIFRFLREDMLGCLCELQNIVFPRIRPNQSKPNPKSDAFVCEFSRCQMLDPISFFFLEGMLVCMCEPQNNVFPRIAPNQSKPNSSSVFVVFGCEFSRCQILDPISFFEKACLDACVNPKTMCFQGL